MRSYCSKCLYPLRTCLCSHITPIKSQTRIDILQHPSETKHAKNTARLVPLFIPQARIWVGETAEDFRQLREDLAKEQNRLIALVYPSQKSLYMTEMRISDSRAQQMRLLYLDGTWKKAFKLLKLNTWLNTIPHLKLAEPNSTYRIRKTSVKGGISTLECVVQSLHRIEPNLDTQALLSCFNQLQSNFDLRS